jgi:cohesin loading factor subunit SCC2
VSCANLDFCSKFQSVSDTQSKLAAGIIALQSQVCRYVPQIVNYMLGYTRDKSSSKLRSRGMSGLEQLIHKDPRVITEGHVKSMVEIFSDTSPMVRESVLSLVSTCLEREPSLERYFLPSILRLTTDPSNGPKKKAIKLLKDVHAGPTSRDKKLQIAAQLLLPSQDDEKAISELSRNVLEDIWFAGAKNNTTSDENQLKLDRALRASFFIDSIQFVHLRPAHLEAFQKFFIYALSPEARGPDKNLRICRDLVADMIDEIISPIAGSDTKVQERNMTALSIFAKVEPALFTVDQIQLLKLYIKEIATIEDLVLVRPTVIIFRYVFATLQSLQQSFAEEIRASLMRNVSKLANFASAGIPNSRDTLIDVAHCLWTVTPMVAQGPLKLCTMITSILCQLRPLIDCTPEQAVASRNKIKSYLILLGTFGKVCDFSQHIEIFKERMAMQAHNFLTKKLATEKQMGALLSTDSPVALMFLDTVRPFTTQQWDMSIREQALNSVGGICQQSPQLFTRLEVEKIFKLVFINHDNSQLRRIALGEFSDYFAFAERRSESGAEIAVGQGAVTGNARLGTSFVGTENDRATLHIAQRFLADFVDSALKNNNELAILATNIIASVSRQGLVHPKECGAALVALGTSSNDRIAHLASTEHKRIHEKQESYLEKEYMQAIRIAFTYQRDIFKDPHGMREATHSPKLIGLFEALKTGKKVSLKKFISNICKNVDFDLAKLDTGGAMPDAILFARFCLENLALLDFPNLEELAICLNALESIVLKSTGPAVALVIETEMPKQFVPTELAPAQDVLHQQFGDAAGIEISFPSFANTAPPGSQLAQPIIDDDRLRKITTACMILQMVWETRGFVRRCYNLHKLTGRIPQKEYPKPAQRNNFVSGKELWERLTPIMNSLDSRETMTKTCYDFAELLDVDREALVGEEGDENGLGADYDTPPEGDDAGSVAAPTSGRNRKRKSNFNVSNTPKKPRGKAAGAKGKKRNSRTPDGDDDSD